VEQKSKTNIRGKKSETGGPYLSGEHGEGNGDIRNFVDFTDKRTLVRLV